jgi:hypothetical protein
LERNDGVIAYIPLRNQKSNIKNQNLKPIGKVG